MKTAAGVGSLQETGESRKHEGDKAFREHDRNFKNQMRKEEEFGRDSRESYCNGSYRNQGIQG